MVALNGLPGTCVLRVTRTCDGGLERTAGYVRVAGVFDGDEVVSGRVGRVRELVALLQLATVQLHFRWSVDGHRQRTTSGRLRVHDELALLTCTATAHYLSYTATLCTTFIVELKDRISILGNFSKTITKNITNRSFLF